MFLSAGCATTVQRLPGEHPLPSGGAQNACESEHWLSLAPTRYELASETHTTRHDDGLGVYRVGEADPESLPALRDELGPSPLLDDHAQRVAPHDRDRIIAAGLGIGGLAALAVGTVLFAGSFETTTVTNANGAPEEDHSVNGSKLAAGSILIGVGFGLGIAGTIVAPDAKERAQADADRYVFRPPGDDPKAVDALVTKHDDAVRARCAK